MHPLVFSVPGPWGQLPVYAYGLCLALGLLGAWYLGRARVRAQPDALSLAFLAALLGAALAAAGGQALLALAGAAAPQPRLSGLALSGPFALAGALGGLALIARRPGAAPRAALWEALAPALPIAYGADALGHYLHGSAFGRLLPEGAPGWLSKLGTFPRWELPGGGLGSPAYVHQLLREVEGAGAQVSAPVHPVQLYGLALALAVLALVWRRPGALGPEGAALPAAAGLLALGHLALDAARYLPGGPPAAGLFVSQWLCSLVAVGALAAWGWARLTGPLERL